MNIAHFDVDENIKPYLKGKTLDFSINERNLPLISDKKSLEIITLKSQSSISDKIIAYFPNLKLIITRTVGTDHIDLKVCQLKNIQVKNILDYGPQNIAEHALGLMIAGARQIISANKEVHQGKFDYKNFLGTGFKEKTLGIIGTGRIGLELIKLTKNFGMKIIAYDIFKNEKAAKDLDFLYVSLDELLKKSDFISIHIPLLPSTKYLIGDKEMKKMKENIILVNTSRGEIINTESIVKNIKKFKMVCLDVIENEKYFSKNNPLLEYNNIIITPHIGFYTDNSIKIIAQKTQELIENYKKNY